MNISSVDVSFKYMWLLEELVKKDLKIKYRKSILGYLWSILNPLLMMTVLTIVFSNLFKFDIPNYPLYLLSGQLLFSFYSDATNQSMTSIINGASLIKKVYLTKYIFPFSRIVSSFITMLFSLFALLIVMLATNSEFYLTLLLVPVALCYLFIFSVGIGMLLATIVVYFRDIEYLYGVFLTIFMYLTPIIYPLSIVPDWLKCFILWNPMTSYVEFFRKCVMYGQWPSLELHLTCIIWAMLMLMIGVTFFEKKENTFILYI